MYCVSAAFWGGEAGVESWLVLGIIETMHALRYCTVDYQYSIAVYTGQTPRQLLGPNPTLPAL